MSFWYIPAAEHDLEQLREQHRVFVVSAIQEYLDTWNNHFKTDSDRIVELRDPGLTTNVKDFERIDEVEVLATK